MNREDIELELQSAKNKLDEVLSSLKQLGDIETVNLMTTMNKIPSTMYRLNFQSNKGFEFSFTEYYFTKYHSKYSLYKDKIEHDDYFVYSSTKSDDILEFTTRTFDKYHFSMFVHWSKQDLFEYLYENSSFGLEFIEKLSKFEENDKMVVDSVLTTVGREGEDVEMLSKETGYKLKFCKYHYNLLDNDYNKTLDKLKFFKEHGVTI